MKLAILTTAALLLAPSAVLAHTPRQQDHTGQHTADAMPEKAPVPPSHSVTITFQGRTTILTVEDLLKLQQVTVHVHNAHRNADEDYAGPLLSDVLAKAGLSPAHENEQMILHSTVVATGTDHYFVVYSCAEVEPAFSNSKVIVALTKNNGLPNNEGGLIELVNTDGAKPARWLHGLTNLNIMTLAANQ
jgi:hypothetical protein